MTKLDFEYDTRTNEQTAYASDTIRVRMVHDEYAENPFTEWGGHWPMIVRYYGNATTYDKHKGASIESVLDRFTDGQIIKHQKAILAELLPIAYNWKGESINNPQAVLDEYVSDYREDFESMADCKREFFTETLGDISGRDKLDALAALFEMIGIPVLRTSTTGYSQGDYADIFIVATPEAMDSFGWSAKQRRDKAQIARDMQAQAELYGAWAWGDVYGYVVETRDSPGDEWEEVDSCFGFYGNDPEKSGLSEQALYVVQYEQRKRATYNATIAAFEGVTL